MARIQLEVPTCIETDRLYLRGYQPGDGAWFYKVCLKNRAHLTRYESGNFIMSIENQEQAEEAVRGLALDWAARNAFFMCALAACRRDKHKDE